MADRVSIEEISRQPLVLGTSCFTDPTGNIGYKTEMVQVSALVRIAAAMETQTDLLRGAQAGFTVAQNTDGLCHLDLSHTPGSRLVSIQVLASSATLATEIAKDFGGALKELVDVANEELPPPTH